MCVVVEYRAGIKKKLQQTGKRRRDDKTGRGNTQKGGL
jgi:hypothetical protein